MENFIVSARKYRPATFLSVVGQNHITSTLRNAISRGQLAHAYLFCGPRGVGKTTCARIFAKAINCQNPGNGEGSQAEACGECESCRSFDEGRSFNIHELDAASNNSIDDIRNLTDQVRIPPQLGRYSVYIIDEVHMLSAAAFNAFLKTLEEPPAHAIFILATTEKHKIIPTILSRCQIFDFNRIKVSDGVDYMKHIASSEGVAYDEESLNLIARKADGGMRDALSMFDKAVSFCGNELRYKEVAQSLNILDYDTYFDVVDVILAGDYGRTLLMFDRVLAQGFSGQTFMSGLGSHLRDLLVAKNPRTAELLDVTGSLMDRYKEQAARCAPDFLFGGIALLTDLDARINTATNQRLLVELALMKLCHLAAPAQAQASVPDSTSAPAPSSGSPDGTPEKKAGTAADYNSPEKKNFNPLAPEASLPPLHRDERPKTEVAESNPAQLETDAPGGEPARPAPASVAEAQVPVAEAQAPVVEVSAPVAETHTPVSEVSAPAISKSAPEPDTATPSHPASATAPETPPHPTATTATTTATTATTATPPAPTPAPTPKRQSLSSITGGRSLSEIMAGTPAPTDTTENRQATDKPTDPDAAEKIERHREKFLTRLAAERPRIGVAWETMQVAGNTVNIRVASTTLRDEVLRYRTETLQLLATIAGIHGAIELEVTVDETVRPTRPIRIEDKLRHLTELNPEVVTLRKTLELEID